MNQKNPPPKDIEAEPVAYIRYVLDDIRDLVVNAEPSELAITRRLDCIEHALRLVEPPRVDEVRMEVVLVSGHKVAIHLDGGPVMDGTVNVADVIKATLSNPATWDHCDDPSPLTCEHTNEVPSVCPCGSSCYCKSWTCAPRTHGVVL